MQKTSLFKSFFKYTSLNILGMIGLSCYVLADTFFVANGVGADGLTALSLVLPTYTFLHGCGLMFGMGGATKYSISKSRNETNDANCVFTNTVIIGVIFSLAFLVMGLIFPDVITRLLGANEDIFQISKIYLQVILMFSPLFILNNIFLCFVRNDGAPQLSMAAMIIGSLSNVVLDYVFVFPLNMGIFGAAIATCIAPIISLMILSPFFIKKLNHFHMVRCNVSGHLIKSIMSSGLPSLITEASTGVVVIVFNSIILRIHGNIGIAAYGIIANISMVVLALYTGVAQGIQPLMSSNYGAGKQLNVKAILHYAMITMLLISSIVYASVFFGAQQIVSLFNSEQNIALQSLATTGIRIYFIVCIFAGFNIIMSVFFTSNDKAQPAHIISLLRGFVIIIPLAFLLSSLGGILGVWFVFPTTEFIVSGISAGLYFYYKRNRPTDDGKSVLIGNSSSAVK